MIYPFICIYFVYKSSSLMSSPSLHLIVNLWIVVTKSLYLIEFHACLESGRSYRSPHLIHFRKPQKHCKLPGILELQPRGVSWSDNKLVPLPGKGDWSSASLGDDIDPCFDDRQSLGVILVVNHLFGDSIELRWLQEDQVPKQTLKGHQQHWFQIQKRF